MCAVGSGLGRLDVCHCAHAPLHQWSNKMLIPLVVLIGHDLHLNVTRTICGYYFNEIQFRTRCTVLHCVQYLYDIL